MNQYKNYSLLPSKGIQRFTGTESIEEIEEIILKENSPILFDTNNYPNIQEALTEVTSCETFLPFLERSFVTKDFSYRKFRQLPTKYIDKTLHESSKNHGRSLQDTFMVCKTMFPKTTLREFFTVYFKSRSWGICSDIGKRLMLINPLYTGDIICNSVSTKDEYNKDMLDWSKALGIPSNVDNSVILDTPYNNYAICKVKFGKISLDERAEIRTNYYMTEHKSKKPYTYLTSVIFDITNH